MNRPHLLDKLFIGAAVLGVVIGVADVLWSAGPAKTAAERALLALVSMVFAVLLLAALVGGIVYAVMMLREKLKLHRARCELAERRKQMVLDVVADLQAFHGPDAVTQEMVEQEVARRVREQPWLYLAWPWPP